MRHIPLNITALRYRSVLLHCLEAASEGADLIEEGDGDPDPRVARTHARVLSAAVDLLAERGYAAFSIDAIVRRTGVAKTTLYRHWPSRAALLVAVIKELEGGGPLPDTGSVRQDLLDFFAGRVRIAQTQRWERSMPALVEAAAHDPELGDIVAGLTTQSLEQISALTRRGQDRGELRGDIDVDLAASVLMGPFVFRRLLLNKSPTSDQVSTVVDMILHGIIQSASTSANDHQPSASHHGEL
jgi:AcrR family transcriptional regulator